MTGMAEQRAAEGIEHLQAAALEMIEAARAFLDVAEEFVSDPEQAANALASLTPLVDLAAALRRRSPGGAGGSGGFAEGGGGAARADGNGSGPSRAPRVEHIDVT